MWRLGCGDATGRARAAARSSRRARLLARFPRAGPPERFLAWASKSFTLFGHVAWSAMANRGTYADTLAIGRSHRRGAQGAQTDPRAGRRRGRLALGAKCLHVLIAQLAEEGVPRQELQPLVDLEAFLRELKEQSVSKSAANRRKGRPPSELLLARASAVIDLLIKAGHDENKAAQAVMRLLVAGGVPPPQQGGDARGWRRLLEWRTDLQHGLVSAEAQHEYQDFTRELDAIPAGERVKRVVDEQLWDRRRRPR